MVYPKLTHAWDLPEEAARTLQRDWAARVEKQDRFAGMHTIAGVDVAYAKASDELVSAVAVLNAATLEVIDQVIARDKVRFPYIPGLFSFRELPALSEALTGLDNAPDLIVCDGQGYAHPRRFGLACHLGVMFDIPTIGCGKKRLLGAHDEPGPQRGEAAPLMDQGEEIGRVLRTQDNINPVYVSIGHRISLDTACDLILKLTPNYRLPETTRNADQLVRKYL